MNYINRKIQRLIWAFRIAWRSLNGRFFIFRDAPDWVVAEYVYCDLRDYGDQASNELLLRMRNLQRRLEAEIAANTDLKG